MRPQPLFLSNNSARTYSWRDAEVARRARRLALATLSRDLQALNTPGRHFTASWHPSAIFWP